MRLGATIDDYLETTDPDALVRECIAKGYRAGAMPPACSVGTRFRGASRAAEFMDGSSAILHR